MLKNKIKQTIYDVISLIEAYQKDEVDYNPNGGVVDMKAATEIFFKSIRKPRSESSLALESYLHTLDRAQINGLLCIYDNCAYVRIEDNNDENDYYDGEDINEIKFDFYKDFKEYSNQSKKDNLERLDDKSTNRHFIEALQKGIILYEL